MTEEKESLAWKLFLQESEKRVAALEAEAEEMKRKADAYVAGRQKARRIFSRFLKT